MKKLFKNKSFVLLFQGALVSSIGTTIYAFAAGLYVQELFPKEIYGNKGAFYFSLVVAVSLGIRVLLSPIAGSLVDKWNKIKIIYITDFIRGFLFLISLFILRSGLTNYEALYLFIIISGLAGVNEALFAPAVSSSLPEIVGMENLQAAQGAQSIVGSIQGIIGVVAGMFLYALVGIEVAILANAVSFLLSGISEMFIKAKHKEASIIPQGKTLIEDIKFGFKYLWEKDGLFTMMMFTVFLNFAFSPFFSVGMPFLFKTELEKGAFHLGFVQIAFSIAMLAGGIIIGGAKFDNLGNAVKKGLFLLSAAFVLSAVDIYLVSYGVIGYWMFYVIYILLSIVISFALIHTNVPMSTGMLGAIDPSVRGRVMSTISALSGGLVPVAIVLGGIIIQYSNVAMLGVFSATIIIFTTFGFMKSKGVQRLFDSFENKTDIALETA